MFKIYLDAERAYLEDQIIKKNIKDLDSFRVIELPLNEGDTLTIEELRDTLRKAYEPILEQGLPGMYFIKGNEIHFDKMLLANKVVYVLNNCYDLTVTFDVISLKAGYSKSIVKVKKVELGIYNFTF